MKQNITRILLLSACMGLSAKAAPFMAVGDNAELFLTAAATVQADDNIYLDPTGEVDDIIYSFTPGVDLVFGKGAVTSGNVYIKDEIRRYADADNQDTELLSVGFKTKYDNGVTKADFNASYAEVAQNDNNINLLGGIVDRDLVNVGGKLEFGLSEKTSLGVGLAFAQTDYSPAAYADSDIWTLPVDLYYKANPKLDWSLGYRYRSTELSGAGSDSDDNFFNIGARGEFTPKLIGQIRLGFTQRSFEAGGDDTQFGFDGSLSYLYSEKTTYRFNVSNDFGNSGFGESAEIFTTGLNVSTKLSEQWYLQGGLNYSKYEYPTRTDDFVQGQISLTYVVNNYLNVGGSYTYRDNGSDNALAEFTNNVFGIAANVRY